MNPALLPVKLKDTWVTVAAERVREIVGAQQWLRMPNSTPQMPGLLAWRGQAIPLIDFALVLGIHSDAASPDSAGMGRILVIQHGHNTAGLAVDEAREVCRISDADLLAAHSTKLRFAVREVDADGLVMPVIDLGQMLQELEGSAGAGVV